VSSPGKSLEMKLRWQDPAYRKRMAAVNRKASKALKAMAKFKRVRQPETMLVKKTVLIFGVIKRFYRRELVWPKNQ